MKLDAFLHFNERKILDNPGKISAELAKSFAEGELEKYRVIQDRLFESDFDLVRMMAFFLPEIPFLSFQSPNYYGIINLLFSIIRLFVNFFLVALTKSNAYTLPEKYGHILKALLETFIKKHRFEELAMK